jgi:hypothetical protein
MKTLAFTVMLSFLLCGAAWAEDPAISQIRKEYQSVRNALATFKVESVEPSEPSTEGGEVKAYRDNKGNIRLIRTELYFESGKEIEEYYYQSGLLIFALYEDHRYNVPSNVTPQIAKEIGGQSFDPKKTTVAVNRYYFKNGRMIRWLNDDKKEVTMNGKEYKDVEKNALDASKKLLAQFK